MRYNKLVLAPALMAALTAFAVAGCAEREKITAEELERPVEIAPVVAEDVLPQADSALEEPQNGQEADTAEVPELEAITFAEIVDIVEPGLGCSFLTGEDNSLLFATGEEGADKPIQAAIKMNGTMVPLIGRGGYSTLEEGTTLSSEALELVIDRAEGEGKKVDESQEWDATLTVTQDEGGTKTYEGRYSCGA